MKKLKRSLAKKMLFIKKQIPKITLVFMLMMNSFTTVYASENTLSSINEGVDIIQKLAYWLAGAIAIFGIIKLIVGWNQQDSHSQTAGLKLIASGAGIALVSATLIPKMKISAMCGLTMFSILSSYLL